MNGVLAAGRTEPGRIYKCWSDRFGVVKGERLGRGVGQFRGLVFFRGEVKRADGERVTAVVGVPEGDNVKIAQVEEVGRG